MTIVMFALTLTIYEIFAIKCFCKNADRKLIHDFLFVGNSNVCPICHHLRDILFVTIYDTYILFDKNEIKFEKFDLENGLFQNFGCTTTYIYI